MVPRNLLHKDYSQYSHLTLSVSKFGLFSTSFPNFHHPHRLGSSLHLESTRFISRDAVGLKGFAGHSLLSLSTTDVIIPCFPKLTHCQLDLAFQGRDQRVSHNQSTPAQEEKEIGKVTMISSQPSHGWECVGEKTPTLAMSGTFSEHLLWSMYGV